jgi:hypothetical protein
VCGGGAGQPLSAEADGRFNNFGCDGLLTVLTVLTMLTMISKLALQLFSDADTTEILSAL